MLRSTSVSDWEYDMYCSWRTPLIENIFPTPVGKAVEGADVIGDPVGLPVGTSVVGWEVGALVGEQVERP